MLFLVSFSIKIRGKAIEISGVFPTDLCPNGELKPRGPEMQWKGQGINTFRLPITCKEGRGQECIS